jgi:hypothetical protein
MRDASPGRAAAAAKSAFGIPIHLAIGVVEALLHPTAYLFGLRNSLCGSPLFDSQRRCDCAAQLMLHMEDVR